MRVDVFLSHSRVDSEAAKRIYDFLMKQPFVYAYLDVIDSNLAKTPDDLADYFQTQLGKCSHLMAVVSSATQNSWWVPFEIGMATEKKYPISTYAAGYCELPDFLKKWPYLRNESELLVYAQTAVGETVVKLNKLQEATQPQRTDYSRWFHKRMKEVLRQ